MLCALLLCLSSSASAATYSVYACSGPGGQPLPNSSWLTSVANPSQTLAFSFGGACGDLSVSASPSDSYALGDGAEYVFDPPSGTTISGYSLTRSTAVDFSMPSGNPQVSAGVRETTGIIDVDRDCTDVVSDCIVPTSAASGSGLALSSLGVGVHCQESSGGCPAGSLNNFATSLASARVDLEDSTLPQVVALGGSLPASTSIAGAHNINVTSTDVGGGVERIELRIDGGAPSVLVPGGSCGQPYTLRQPCPSGFFASFNVDTRQLTNGLHIGSARSIDAAGNVSDSEAFAFTVTAGGKDANSLLPSNGTPAVERPLVRAERSLIAAARGRTVAVEGRLLTEQGQPIAGAKLQVTSLDLGVFDAEPRSLGEVTTSSTGHFAARVRSRGAQRVTVTFKPTATSLGTAVASTIVRENLTLSIKRSRARVKPRGRLTLSGRLGGAGDAAGGAPIEIDVKIGGTWRAVGVVETSSSGRYRWNYRFSRVTQPTRFTFRAQLRRNKSWPWPTKTSKRVRVLVAG